MSRNGVEFVLTIPRCRVPVSSSCRTTRDCSVGYKGHTEPLRYGKYPRCTASLPLSKCRVPLLRYVVPKLPKCRVQVLRASRTCRSVRYRYRARTEACRSVQSGDAAVNTEHSGRDGALTEQTPSVYLGTYPTEHNTLEFPIFEC